MTEEDLQTARRFAQALPVEPFGGPILRVIAEVERREGIEKRARGFYHHGTGHTSAVAAAILGEAS